MNIEMEIPLEKRHGHLARELSNSVLCDEVLPGITKAFSMLAFDLAHIQDADAVIDEFAHRMKTAVSLYIEQGKTACKKVVKEF